MTHIKSSMFGQEEGIFTPILTIQTKLKVGEPNDVFEQEADQVAEEVMGMPAHAVADALPNDLPQGGNQGLARFLPSVNFSDGTVESQTCDSTTIVPECEEEVQRAVEIRDNEEEIEIQAKQASPEGNRPVILDSRSLNALNGAGQSLSGSTRSFFERRMDMTSMMCGYILIPVPMSWPDRSTLVPLLTVVTLSFVTGSTTKIHPPDVIS